MSVSVTSAPVKDYICIQIIPVKVQSVPKRRKKYCHIVILYYVEQEVGSRQEESLQVLVGLSVNRHGIQYEVMGYSENIEEYYTPLYERIRSETN